MRTSMARFTQTQSAGMFSPSESSVTEVDPNAIFSEMKRFFVATCQAGTCAVPDKDSSWRSYKYKPDPDSPFLKAWEALGTSTSVPAAFQNAINEDFTFSALPSGSCPYNSRYC